MSEQIKYEAVFGDQALFNDADYSCEGISTSGRWLRFNHAQDGIVEAFDDYSKIWVYFGVTCTVLAMRRIIKTPVWTKEDQKAGKSPEAGAEVMCMDDSRHNFVGESIHAGHWALCHGKTKKVFHIPATAVRPVETEAERQQRVRIEWSRTASKIANETQGGMSAVYDALLSGELKMPEVQK